MVNRDSLSQLAGWSWGEDVLKASLATEVNMNVTSEKAYIKSVNIRNGRVRCKSIPLYFDRDGIAEFDKIHYDKISQLIKLGVCVEISEDRESLMPLIRSQKPVVKEEPKKKPAPAKKPEPKVEAPKAKAEAPKTKPAIKSSAKTSSKKASKK